jgi:hypothetical protein
MRDFTAQIAMVVSILSFGAAAAAWWVSREKLRLDLYNRRFDVYLKTLDFWYALSRWKPTDKEILSCNLVDSPELSDSQIAFIKASRESQFLFDDSSGMGPQRLIYFYKVQDRHLVMKDGVIETIRTGEARFRAAGPSAYNGHT